MSSTDENVVKGALTSKETLEHFLPFFNDAMVDISDVEPIRIIGEGGFATVYKCRQLSTQEVVAVKVLKPDMVSSERDVYDFLLEAQLLHKLRHQSIVRFKGICYGKLAAKHSYESICVVTEFVECGSLREWIHGNSMKSDHSLYSKRTALKWMIDIAKGLEYLHKRRFPIIHRDLKPANILLSSIPGNPNQYTAKLTDFGLSAVVSSKRDRMQSSVSSDQGLDEVDSDALPELLKHGKERVQKTAESLRKALAGVSMLIRSEANDTFNRLESTAGATKKHLMTGKKGSLLYMAPEVLRSDLSNEKVDVFSFAIVLYEILQGIPITQRFGQRPSITAVSRFTNSVRDGYRLPIPDNWPDEVKQLITECWNDDAHSRPSMRRVVLRLTSMYESGMFSPASAMKREKRRNHILGFLRRLIH